MNLARDPARRRRIRVGAAALVVVAALLAAAGCGALRAGRILRDAIEPGEDVAAAVVESRTDVETSAGRVRVVLLRPAEEAPPYPAVVLVHGAVDAGAEETRLLNLGRALAAHGMVVAAPQLDALAKFRMDPADVDRVAGVTEWLADSALAEDGRAALLGISVGGSYGIVAAARPQVRDRVSAILCFGAYADLGALLEGWLTERRPPGERMFDPLTEGRRLVLLGNADALAEPEARDETRRRIRALLDGGRDVTADGLPPRAREAVAVAISTEPIPREQAQRLLAAMGDAPAALSPARAASVPGAPIYLLHGAEDPVVPVAGAETLRAALAARGADVRVHVTDVFGHVDAEDGGPGLIEAWPLLRFVAEFLDDAGL